MEEKNQVDNKVEQENGKNKKFGSVVLIILPLVVLGIILILCLTNTKNIESKNTAKVDYSQTEVRNQTEKNDIIENVSNESSVNETKSDEEISDSKKLAENTIVVEGIFGIDAGDIGYKFNKNGNVTRFGNVTEEKGTYKTIGENEIEITLTEKSEQDLDTLKTTDTKINETLKVKIIDENTILIDGEKFKKVKLDSIVLSGSYGYDAGDLLYRFDIYGNVTLSGSIDEKKGTYVTVAENVVEITYTEETIWNIDNGTSTTKKINETEKVEVIDENTISIDGEKYNKVN